MDVHRSNRVEELFSALARTLSTPLPDPFASEIIVVPSRGLATWVSMRLAEHHGVWAGATFPFPRRFIHDMFTAVLPDACADGPGADAFTASRLVWPILAELPEQLEHGAFAELKRFLGAESGVQGSRATATRLRFQLAERIAEVFDRYIVFRPELLLAWDRERDDDWQARLWRAVTRRIGVPHPAALARAFVARLTDATPPPGLPARVSVFGLSSLPPLYVDLLAALARHVEVHLFVVSPSQEYWAEIQSKRERLRAARQHDDALALDLDVPPLLASLGVMGRDFQRVLEERVDYREDDRSLYVDPGPATLLTTVQSDLLHLRGRGAGGSAPVQPLATGDDSIAIHVCHSPMREVEVLHDRLLDLLDRDPTLEPHDIAVMMSDLDTYAPLVEAVFDRGDGPTRIPYCIADRSLRGDSPTIDAFQRILALVGGRVTASEVLDLLGLEPITARFRITAEDLDRLTAWVSESGIRWGIDRQHREEHAQPAFDENTWRFGLERLFLGYAMTSDGGRLFERVLPYDEIEGQETALLGQLADVCEILFVAARRLAPPRAPRQWQRDLTELVDALLAGPTSTAWDVQQLRTALEAIAREAEDAGFTDPIELDAMRTLVLQRIEDDRPARGFLAGGVTFCAMLPMRSVPFRVVAVLGLGDGQFPRTSPTISFDRIPRSPRAGDRSRRDDDRYLFLEALLAARERFLLFYVGQSIQDNRELPPSVVVSELLDALASAFVPPGRDAPDLEALRAALVLSHPMQPFSPRYFGADPDPRLRSYAEHYLDGARALASGRSQHTSPRFFPAPLPPIPATADLPLSRLLEFYRLPAADLLRRRLGVNLRDLEREHSDREPMELGILASWHIGDTLLRQRLEQLEHDRSFEILRASGVLPLGTTGVCRHETIEAKVEPIAEAAMAWRTGERLADLPIELAIAGRTIRGSLHDRWPRGCSQPQYGKLAGHHLLLAWIRHLVLCAAAPRDQEHVTIVIGRDDKQGAATHVFRRVDDARALLGDLVQLYDIGQYEPLLLFPRSAYAFSQKFREHHDVHEALELARSGWNSEFGGDGKDPYVDRLFGTTDPLALRFSLFEQPMHGEDFATLSCRVFGPLLNHLERS